MPVEMLRLLIIPYVSHNPAGAFFIQHLPGDTSNHRHHLQQQKLILC